MTTNHEGFEPYQLIELDQLGVRAEAEALTRKGVSCEDAFIRIRKAARAAAKTAALAAVEAAERGESAPATTPAAAAKAAAQGVVSDEKPAKKSAEPATKKGGESAPATTPAAAAKAG